MSLEHNVFQSEENDFSDETIMIEFYSLLWHSILLLFVKWTTGAL